MTVFLNNLKRIFGKKRNILFMLVLPILANFYIITATTQISKYNIGVLDNDNTAFTSTFIGTLEKDANITILPNDEEISNMILDRKMDIAIVFGSGFTDKILKGEDIKLTNYILGDTNQAGPIQISISSFLVSAQKIASAADGNEEEFYDGLNDFVEQKFAVEYNHFSVSYIEDINNALTAIGYLAVCLVFFVTITTSLMLQDKLAGIKGRTLISPIRSFSYYTQHLFSYYLLAVIQVLAVILILPQIATVIFGSSSTQVFNIVIISCLFALACVSIGIFVNSFSKNTFMAGTLNTFIGLPMLMLGGCLWPREIMPDTMQKVGSFLPTTWFMVAAEKILNGRTFGDALTEMLLIVGFSAIMMAATFVISKKEKG